MSFFAVLFALLIEQLKPLPRDNRIHHLLVSWVGWTSRNFDAGKPHHQIVVWCVAVLSPALAVGLVYVAVREFSLLLALAFDVGLLYLTLGFRQFSHFFTDIHLALRLGELDRARSLLGQWRQASSDRLSSGEIARLSIEEALVGSHRHVFGPLACFALVGPGGALLYRLSAFFARHWNGGGNDPAAPRAGHFGDFAGKAFGWIDWLPVRLSAAGFAIVGDFEDAVFCWRSQSANWSDASAGILIASGAGAIGVRLGQPIHGDLGIGEPDLGDRPEMGMGDEADADYMQSTIGLVWRTLLLGLMVLALVWVSGWVG